jgi:hypothetical protein
MQQINGLMAGQMAGVMTAKQREDAMYALQGQATAAAATEVTPKDDVMNTMQLLVQRAEDLTLLASSKLESVTPTPPAVDKISGYASAPQRDTSGYPPLYSAMITMLRSIEYNLDSVRVALLKANT